MILFYYLYILIDIYSITSQDSGGASYSSSTFGGGGSRGGRGRGGRGGGRGGGANPFGRGGASNAGGKWPRKGSAAFAAKRGTTGRTVPITFIKFDISLLNI